MITVFGIKNCDTMKKTFRWLDDNHIEYRFHDYKKAGLEEATAIEWVNTLGWEQIINKRGTTWRKLDDETKSAMDNTLAPKTMIENPSIIKRPLIMMDDNQIILGFDAEELTKQLS